MTQSTLPDPTYPGKAALLARTLIEALTAQRDLYIHLASLARQQSDDIATGNSESLMSVLSARSQLIDQLAPIDLRLQPFKNKWDATLSELSPADRATAGGLLTQVRQLLADILAQDEADRLQLERQKTDIGAQIKKTVTGTQLHHAYGMKSPRHQGHFAG